MRDVGSIILEIMSLEVLTKAADCGEDVLFGECRDVRYYMDGEISAVCGAFGDSVVICAWPDEERPYLWVDVLDPPLSAAAPRRGNSPIKVDEDLYELAVDLTEAFAELSAQRVRGTRP